MAFRPGSAIEFAFYTEESISIQAQNFRTHNVDGVQCIANDHLLCGEGRVKPVQRRLPFLEIMQINPAPRLAVDANDDRCCAPVGLLEPGLEEDHPL